MAALRGFLNRNALIKSVPLASLSGYLLLLDLSQVEFKMPFKLPKDLDSDLPMYISKCIELPCKESKEEKRKTLISNFKNSVNNVIFIFSAIIFANLYRIFSINVIDLYFN